MVSNAIANTTQDRRQCISEIIHEQLTFIKYLYIIWHIEYQV